MGTFPTNPTASIDYDLIIHSKGGGERDVLRPNCWHVNVFLKTIDLNLDDTILEKKQRCRLSPLQNKIHFGCFFNDDNDDVLSELYENIIPFHHRHHHRRRGCYIVTLNYCIGTSLVDDVDQFTSTIISIVIIIIKHSSSSLLESIITTTTGPYWNRR